MISPELTENAFNAFFNNIGFQRMSDDAGNSPEFRNADYVHLSRKTVVELKEQVWTQKEAAERLGV